MSDPVQSNDREFNLRVRIDDDRVVAISLDHGNESIETVAYVRPDGKVVTKTESTNGDEVVTATTTKLEEAVSNVLGRASSILTGMVVRDLTADGVPRD